MQTQATIKRWGNSLAIRIPKSILDSLQFEQDATVSLVVDDGRLVVAPLLTLDDFVSAITDENRHDEADWGEPVGNEVW